MSPKKKQNWKSGDIFSIPLGNGKNVIGQIISKELDALNSVVCALTTVDAEKEKNFGDYSEKSVLSVAFITPDLLDSGVWKVISNKKTIDVSKYIDLGELRENGFIGVKVIGSGNVLKFLKACCGLLPWNLFHDKEYFDKMLCSPDKKPKSIYYE